LTRSRPRASSASILGSRWPAISASSMARPETPKRSVATVESLIRASSGSLLQPLGVPGAVGGQVGTQPGVSRSRRIWAGGTNEGRSMPRSLQLGQPHRIQLVGLGPARQVLDVTGVDQPHHQPPRLQQVHERPPILGGGLDHDPLDPLAGQLLGQPQDRGGRGDLPDRGDALARPGGMGHPGTDHAGRLGDIDRGDPAQDLLVLVDLDLLVCWHRPSSSITGRKLGCPGLGWDTETLTGVLVATVRDPAVGPRRQTQARPPTAKDTSASAGNPPHFHASTASHRGYFDSGEDPRLRWQTAWYLPGSTRQGVVGNATRT
jgi:hypothetical protein